MPLYVPLPPAVEDALRRSAWQDLRDPRMQARFLVEEALRQRGVLPAADPRAAAEVVAAPTMETPH
jgi:hypothetical protein